VSAERLNLTQAAALTGKHRNTLRGWVKAGRFRTAALEAGAWTVGREELEALAPKPAAATEQPSWDLVLARAEARNDFLLERLAQAERERATAERDARIAEMERDAVRAQLEALRNQSPPRPPGELVSRVSGLFRRIRR